MSEADLLGHVPGGVLVDDRREAVAVIPLELAHLTAGNLGAADEVAFVIVSVVVGAIGEQAVARTGFVALAVAAGGDTVAVGVVGVRLRRVGRRAMVGLGELVAVIVAVVGDPVRIGGPDDPAGRVISEIVECDCGGRIAVRETGQSVEAVVSVRAADNELGTAQIGVAVDRGKLADLVVGQIDPLGMNAVAALGNPGGAVQRIVCVRVGAARLPVDGVGHRENVAGGIVAIGKDNARRVRRAVVVRGFDATPVVVDEG